jgi:hypothetical protein
MYGNNVHFYEKQILNFSILINHGLYRLLAILQNLDKIKY